MRILDRYLLKEMTGPFLVGLVVYSFLFLVNLLFQLASLSIQQGLSPSTAGLLFLLSLPSLLSYTIPIAVLLAAILALSRLSADSEVTALRAAGIPMTGLLRAPLLFGACAAGLLLLLNLWWIPLSRTAADRLQADAAKALNLVRLLRPGVFFDRVPGVLLYTRKADLATDTYRDIFVYQRPTQGEDLLTTADWARIVQSREAGILQFIAGDGQTLRFHRKKPGQVDVSTFETQTLTLEVGNIQAAARGKGLPEMYLRELLAKLDAAQGTADPALQRQERFSLRYELHRRLAGAAVPLCFVLFGIPLGLVNVRGGRGAGFTLSLLLVLGYWILLSALGDMASTGRLHPEAAAWLPNAAVLALAVPLLRYREKFVRWKVVEGLHHLIPGPRHLTDPGEEEVEPIPATGGVTLLDRYVLRRLLFYLVLITSSILLLYWIIEARGLSEFLRSASHWRMLGTYLLNQSPAILCLLAPLAVLLTALVTFGILEKNGELTAAKSSGISLYRLSLPALVLALGASGLLYALGEGVVPATSRKAQQARDRIKNLASRNVAKAVDVWVFAPDRKALYHYNHFDAKKRVFHGFSVYTLEEGRFRVLGRLFAKRARFESKNELAYKRGWEWVSGRKKPFKEKPSGTVSLPIPESFLVVPPFLEGQFFSSKELKRLIGELRDKGYSTYAQKMDYYRKSADAAAPLALLLAGLPFAFSVGRKGSLAGIAVALAICISYYVLGAVFNAVGQMQWLDPAFAAWAPVILLALGGGYLLLNLRT